MLNRAQILVLVFLSAALSNAEAAMRQYHAKLDESSWELITDSRLQCKLQHDIPRYGNVSFASRASKNLNIDFQLDMMSMPAVYQQAEIISMPPQWHPGKASVDIGSMAIKKQFNPDAPLETAWFMLTELEKGMMPTIYYKDWQNPRDHVAVGLSSVNFHDAYDAFRRCSDNLLKYSFDDISYTVLNYQSNSDKLTKESAKRMAMIAEYLRHDGELELVLVDAYTDSYGGRWPNQQLSERRANSVKGFFVELGIDETRIDVEGHGEKRHIASNQTTLGRGKNRRVVIRMAKP